MESKQFSAAIAAITEMGVLSGLRIERKEVGAPGEFDAITDDELVRLLIERFSALGLNTDAGGDTRHRSCRLGFRSGHTSRRERKPAGVVQFGILQPALVSGIVQS
jgi:hypothetical protein